METKTGYVIMRYKPRVLDGCFTDEMTDGDGKRCYGRIGSTWDYPNPTIFETKELAVLEMEWLKKNRLKFLNMWEVSYDKKTRKIIDWIKKNN